jgi:hypothetical protein
MTPKQRRDSLFRHTRPEIRGFELYDGDEYHKDVKLLWVAHQKEPIHLIPEEITQEEFAQYVEDAAKKGDLFVIEDENNQYDGFGPVGMGFIMDNGWKYEPHINFFPWSTKKNILRSVVAGLQWARYSRKIGCILIHSLEESKNLFDHVCKYGVLHYVGKIVNGDERGDEYLYSVRGKRNVTRVPKN